MRPLAALATMLVMLAGCASTVEMRAGTRPDVNVLDKSLEVGKSTRQAVQVALGIPDGHGRSMMPWQGAPRTVWSYYYEEGVVDLGGGSSDDRRIFLFVFLDGDRYDGYLWFSSLKAAP